jgi:hypothetical protein
MLADSALEPTMTMRTEPVQRVEMTPTILVAGDHFSTTPAGRHHQPRSLPLPRLPPMEFQVVAFGQSDIEREVNVPLGAL